MTSLGSVLVSREKNYANGQRVQAFAGSHKVRPQTMEPGAVTTVDALDLRVAAYLRLNNISAARRDAVLMLRTDKKDGRGYIRCGQIEGLTGDIPAASQWYEHGLRRVPESDRLHAYIKEQLRKITVASRPRDPVAALPTEIMELVLSYLLFRDIVRAMRVSKLWAEVLQTLRPTSDTIDFRIACKDITGASTSGALRRIKSSAKILHFANLSEAARRFLKSHLSNYENFPKLQTLSLSSVESGLWALPFSKYPLREIELSDDIGVEMSTIVRILKNCKSLVVGKFKDILVPGDFYPDVVSEQDFKPGVAVSRVLEVLHLDCQAGPRGYINLQSILPCFPSLTEVECSYSCLLGGRISCDLSKLRHLRKLRFNNVMCYLPKLPSSLEAWGSTSCSYSAPDDFFKTQYYHLSSLRILGMANCSGYIHLSQFLEGGTNSKITHLDCTGWRADRQNLPLDRLPSLRVLRTGGELSDDKLIRHVSRLQHLEELHITSSSVTNVQLAEIIRLPDRQLQYIRLNDCPKVTPDIVKLAESKGITVVFKNPPTEGRRLRMAD